MSMTSTVSLLPSTWAGKLPTLEGGLKHMLPSIPVQGEDVFFFLFFFFSHHNAFVTLYPSS